MNDRLQTDFQFFVDNHASLFEEYPNMYLVISDKKVLFTRPTFEEAYKMALDNGLPIGSFIVQQCTEGDESYTQTFHSRVIFN